MSIVTYPCEYRFACEEMALLVRVDNNERVIRARRWPEDDGMIVGDRAFCTEDSDRNTLRFTHILRRETTE